ncbi:hypothetical protein IEQ34_004737 [Dendrobium chrysotoxum]|uniref:NB-ARC domain-containing protein n=1 Tax=Dendrobium chrysotoxum TaxID=161865 RepID=A0AAV7HH94_DENCH|nr:hypothetical protein IEQ34_004737 [Dendrobium chrysotoxum]
MKKELERLRENHPKIQAVIFAANQAQINDKNRALNRWIWQLRDDIDEADDKIKFMSFLFECPRKILKIGERLLKRDPNLKRLEEAVQKLDKVSADVTNFLHLLDSAKQEQKEQEVNFYKTRETGSLPKNGLIGRDKDKEFVMQWLRMPSNEEHQALVNGTDLCRKIYVLSIVGHGDMLESLKKERPHLDTLDALQKSLRTEIMSKKFLLVLDDIWEHDEKQDESKWEKVLVPLAYGSFGSRILVTTRMDSVAMMIAKVIKKKTEIFRLEGLVEDQCLQLLNSHSFADVENPNDYKRLRSIAGEIIKKLSGSPLAAKVIGGVLNSSLDERHWTKVLNSDFVSSKLGQNDIFLILRLSYMFLPKHLQNCFTFCFIFQQDYWFRKDDLVKMWIALGFIQQPHGQEWTMEDIGGRIGKLKSLQELNMFDLRDVSGYRIGELENMNDRCKLRINCLENVKDAKEACSAKICAKRRLTFLTLCWSNTNLRNIGLDENVLDNLHPPKYLRNLSIKRYMGARFAIRMNYVNPIFDLEIIELTDCLECETLPPFGQLPFLKSLTLSNMPKVKWLESKFNGNDKYHAFPLLEALYICGLEALEDWFEAGVAAEDGCLFPCLIELVLNDWPKLKELPSFPPKLKSLQIEKTGWTTLNFCSNSNHIPLKSLDVFRCPNITSLPLADEIARLASLRYLMIRNCPNLISLGRYREVETTNNCHFILNHLVISDPSVLLMEPLRSIAAVKKLTIEHNDEVVSFPNEAEQWFLKVRSSLSELQFGCLKSLQSLPSSLESLS